MLCYCDLIRPFPARCDRFGCASGLTRGWDKYTSLVLQIIVNGVSPSMGSREFFLRTTRDSLGSLDEAMGRRGDVMRWACDVV